VPFVVSNIERVDFEVGKRPHAYRRHRSSRIHRRQSRQGSQSSRRDRHHRRRQPRARRQVRQPRRLRDRRYVDKEEFLTRLADGDFEDDSPPCCIEGACSTRWRPMAGT
jgi:hypothetical protein